MARYQRIQRNRTNSLTFRQRRKGLPLWFFTLWLPVFAFAMLTIWQFNSIQPRVLAVVGIQPTPTPAGVMYATWGDSAFWAGNLDEAVTNYRWAAEREPKNIDILYELARVLIYRSYGDVRFAGDIQEAEQWAAQAAAAAPESARANTIYCYALVRANKSSAAVQACIRAIDINPSDAEAHAYLAMAQYDLNRTASSFNESEEAVRLNPNSIDANMAHAANLAFNGRVQSAIDHYKRAASVNPKLEFPYFQMAFFVYTLANGEADQDRAEGLYRIALSAYNTVLQGNPNSVKAYTRLCQTYLAKGEPKLAAQYCQEATEIDSQSSQAWRWLGEVYHKSRNYEDAVDALKTCADLEEAQGIPKALRDPTCWWLRGVGWFVLGDCNRAIPILEDVLTWATDPIAVRETRRTIDKCATAYQGTYKTPTPVPSPTVRPTPIL